MQKNPHQKILNGQVTRFVYGMGGELVAEYEGATVNPLTPTKEYLYGATGLLAVSEGTTIKYLTPDHLGSTRVITDSTGQVVTRQDFYPFGREIEADKAQRGSLAGYGAVGGVRQKFTGYERDEETGLDFAQARYFFSGYGRFTSVDPVVVSEERLIDPQRINLYNYARNNPLRFIDATGQDIDDSSLDDNKDYQSWKKAFLSTKSGRALWDKYATNKNFKLVITAGKNKGGNEGAETTNYTFGKDGNVNGATIILGSNLGENPPTNTTDYPVNGSLTESDPYSNYRIGQKDRAVGIIAHEFGHLEYAQALGPAFREQQQMFEDYGNLINELGGTRAASGNPRFQEFKQRFITKFGNTPESLDILKENLAERTAVPVIKDHFGSRLPDRVKKAIQKFERK